MFLPSYILLQIGTLWLGTISIFNVRWAVLEPLDSLIYWKNDLMFQVFQRTHPVFLIT